MLRLPKNCITSCAVHCRCASNVNSVSVEVEPIIKPNGFQDRNAKKKVSSSFKNHKLPHVKPLEGVLKVGLSDSIPRFNDFNIQMISKSMCDTLFGKNMNSKLQNFEEYSRAVKELEKHGLMTSLKDVPDVNFKLPELEGETIVEHFYNIGEKQSSPYRKLIMNLLTKLPKTPLEWQLNEGWTKYTDNGFFAVDFPDDDALIFDVEVCCSEGDMPTIATAVGNSAWYAWVSSDLLHGSKRTNNNHYTLERLIPLESKNNNKRLDETNKKPRIVVGHNVGYDRARVKEQYWIERTALRFLDTLSLHVSVSGVTSYQKNLLKAGLGQGDEWSKLSSLNSLSKVHGLYCGSEISKEKRDVFVTGNLDDVLHNFQSLMSYCASDVIATHNILCKLFPMYLSRFPHPVSLAGILELGLAYLPINSNWNQYIQDCNNTYDDLDHEAKLILSNLADNACQFLHNEQYKNHLWLWDQDWSVRNLSLKKKATVKSVLPKENTDKNTHISDFYCGHVDTSQPLAEDSYEDPEYTILSNKFQYLMDMNKLLPSKTPHLPGYPAWYTKLCERFSSPDWIAGPQLISTGMQIAPKLLSLTWKSLPLHYVRGHGWGMLVPFKTDIKLGNEDVVPLEQLVSFCQNVESELFCKCKKKCLEGKTVETFNCDKSHLHRNMNDNGVSVFCKSKIGSGCGLIKLPHKDGKHLNVGNPLARDYIHKFSKNELGSGDPKTERLIEISRMLSYWRNNRERVENQVTIWLSKNDIPRFMVGDKDLGAILPQVIVCGTLTRRAVEPTWMTASNATGERVGSELRAMITAPPSYSLVGADVDSQELWIASVIGDAYSSNQHGATPFGWMTLSGQKSDGTDMHSVTAKAIGISRNHAKVINYARIYGAGQPFAEHLLKQFNPEMSSSEAKQKASKMFSITKGKRVYILKEKVLPNMTQRTFSKYGAKEICALYGKDVDDLFEKPKWVGGTESAMFNCLEEIASDIEPRTPFLKGRLSRALEPHSDTYDKFTPTRVNWVVQSGAVDFLHLMLVCMRWLLGPDIRFCLSFHDEVRYLVPNTYRYQVALALHVTNLYTRAFCISQLGLTDVPRSVAFFSSVEVDTVLRKEADHDCKTPSNPFGLSKGFGIPPGESLNIDEAVKKSRGIVGLPTFRKKKHK